MTTARSTTARRRRALAAPVLLTLALAAGCGTVQADSSPTAQGASPAGSSATRPADPEPPQSARPESGAGAQADTAATVRQAADASASAGSSRVALDTTVSMAGTSQRITGTGVLDYAANSGQLRVDLGDLGSLEEIITPDAVYIRMPETGDSWIKAPMAAFGADVLGGIDPADTFAQLADLAEVIDEGEDSVEGVPATRYSATIDLADALARSGLSGEDLERIADALEDAGAATATIRVWVDGQGRVIRTTQDLALTVPGAGRVESTSTIRFFDFGVTVDITPPPDADVVEAPEGMLDGGPADVGAA